MQKYLLIIATVVITCFSFSFNNGVSSGKEKAAKIARSLWGDVTLKPINDLLTSDIPEYNQFFDFNNEVFALSSALEQEGIVCIRTNKSAPFPNWKGKDTRASIYQNGNGNVYDPVKYSIVIGKDLKVKEVKVLEMRSDYGNEVQSKSWLNQFIGYDGRSIEYGREIDGVSGATVTASGLTEDIEATYKGLKQLYGLLSEGPN